MKNNDEIRNGFGELLAAFLEKLAGAKGLIAIAVAVIGFIVWFLFQNQGTFGR